MMRKLIITADDYGMSIGVNKAIDEGIEVGLITATNVMVNMPYFEEAKKLKEYEGISVGIHFTLSCGKPISNAKDIASLVDEKEEFYKYSDFRKRYRKGLIKNEDILIELKAQYDKYKELLGEPDYWNTHENVHVDFKIYRLFVNFAKECGINKMRSHQRLYVQGSQKGDKRSMLWRVTEPLKSRMLNCWQNNAHKKGIKSPNGLICCLRKGDINKLQYLFNNIVWKKKKIAEYVIHPAIENDSKYFGLIVEQRIKEYKMFTSQETKKFLDEARIVLANYRDIDGE